MKVLGRRLRSLSGNAGQRAIDAACYALGLGVISTSSVRDVLRVEGDFDFSVFEEYLSSSIPLVRIEVAKIIVKKGDGSCVVKGIIRETDVAVQQAMISHLRQAEYKEVDDLVVLLSGSDDIIAETVLQLCVAVGRADLLFSLAVNGDEKTINRVRRYLDEQGWLD